MPPHAIALALWRSRAVSAAVQPASATFAPQTVPRRHTAETAIASQTDPWEFRFVRHAPSDAVDKEQTDART